MTKQNENFIVSNNWKAQSGECGAEDTGHFVLSSGSGLSPRRLPCVCEMLWGAWRSSFSFLVDGLTACYQLFLEHLLILSIAMAMVEQNADWLRCQSHDPLLARVGQLGALDLEKGSEGPCGDVR